MPSKIQSYPLEKALSYTNDDVVRRFTTLYDVSFEEASDIFEETKKWLWLSVQAKAHHMTTTLSIKPTLLIIDEMWHNFLLFTEDYSDYCRDYLGYFVPHKPAKRRQKEIFLKRFEDSPQAIRQEQQQGLQRQCQFICEQLGSKTLLKWFVEFPQRYTSDFFKNQRCDLSPKWVPPPELQALASHVKGGKIVVKTVAESKL